MGIASNQHSREGGIGKKVEKKRRDRQANCSEADKTGEAEASGAEDGIERTHKPSSGGWKNKSGYEEAKRGAKGAKLTRNQSGGDKRRHASQGPVVDSSSLDLIHAWTMEPRRVSGQTDITADRPRWASEKAQRVKESQPEGLPD